MMGIFIFMVGMYAVRGGDICHEWWGVMPGKVGMYAVNGGEVCRERWGGMPGKVGIYAVNNLDLDLRSGPICR